MLSAEQAEAWILSVRYMAAVSTWRGFASASGKRRLLFGVITTASA